jgi:hypothetical protein
MKATYESSPRGETISYEIEGGKLHASTGGINIAVELIGGGVVQKEGRFFSTWFRIGAAGFVIGSFTFAVVAFKEGRIRIGDLGPYGYVHLGLIIVGLALVIAFRRPLVYKEVTRGGEGIMIWKKRGDDGGFERFSQQVAREIEKGALESPGSGGDESAS